MEAKVQGKNETFFSSTRILIISAIILILIGGLILNLPVSSKTGKSIGLKNAFYTSASAVCVTGSISIVPGEQLSLFGQIVLLILIQLGGLGIMCFVTLVLLLLGKKINLSDRLLLQESLNQRQFGGLVQLIKLIFKYTIILETMGAVIISFRFIPMYGYGTGIFYSIFHSISSLCNAGVDLFENNSMRMFDTDVLINLTTMALIVLGGLGFAVWKDVLDNVTKGIKNRISLKKIIHKFSLHTKIVLSVTIILLISGTLIILCLEYNNEATLKEYDLGEKILISAFQSTSLRTAGFQTIDFSKTTIATKFISLLYMFIGGSSGSTAGGIKTVTFAVMMLSIYSFIKGRKEVKIFDRSISFEIMKRTMVVVVMSLAIIFISILILLITEADLLKQNDMFMAIIYEVVGAFTTTGLTLGITGKISLIGKMVLFIVMIIGRLGPITISVAIFKKDKNENNNTIAHPNEDVLIG